MEPLFEDFDVEENEERETLEPLREVILFFLFLPCLRLARTLDSEDILLFSFLCLSFFSFLSLERSLLCLRDGILLFRFSYFPSFRIAS